MTEWAVESRYPGNWPEAIESDAEKALKQAKQIWGVRAVINQQRIVVGNRRMIPAAGLESQGKTLLFLESNDQLVGILAAADTLRAEAPAALEAVRALGIRHIELLTGDNERTASTLAEKTWCFLPRQPAARKQD